MLEAALAYLEHGFSIFPCGEKSKKPRVDWTEYQNRKPTVEEVTQWWTQWPKSNIAIVTGRISGIVVVDVDPKHGGKSDGLPATSLIAITGGDPRGEHWFYKYPENATRIPNQVNSEKCRDVARRGKDIRADGGYVMAAPSVHDVTKNRYAWKSFDPNNLGTAPNWALVPLEDAPEEKEPWLTKLINEGTNPGQRNDDLTRLAGYFASLAMPMDVTMAIVGQWMHAQKVPLASGEVDVTVRSVYRTERRRNPERFKAGKPKRDLFPTHTLSQFMHKYGGQEVRWAVENWLPDQTIAFLVSPPGGFKTWLTYDLAVSIASGQPFLGRFAVNEPGPVLVVNQEDFNSQTAERHTLIVINRLGLQKPELTDEYLTTPWMPKDRDLPLHYHADRLLRFDDTEVMDALEEFVKSVRPKLCIIDPLYQAVDTEDHMVKAASQMSRLKTMRDRYKASFMVVHHTRKQASTSRLDTYGSQLINAFAETGLRSIVPSEGSPIIGIKRYFKAFGSLHPVKLTFGINSDEFRYGVDVEDITNDELEKMGTGNLTKTTVGPEKSLKSRIIETLAVTDDGLSLSEISLSLGVGTEKVAASLRTLVKTCDVREKDNGNWIVTVPIL
jgi:hypothetical protein